MVVQPPTNLLFTSKAPASSVTELQQKLKNSLSGGLNISEAMDGAVDSLVEIVRNTATGTASDRSSVEDFLAAVDLIEDGKRGPWRRAIPLAGLSVQAAFRTGFPWRVRSQFAGVKEQLRLADIEQI